MPARKEEEEGITLSSSSSRQQADTGQSLASEASTVGGLKKLKKEAAFTLFTFMSFLGGVTWGLSNAPHHTLP